MKYISRTSIQNLRGFTLIETLVAISLLTVAIAAPMSLASQSLSSAFYARDQITAFYLAQEAIETVRAVRDGNALRIVQGGSADLLGGIPSTQGAPFYVDTLSNTMTPCDTTPGASCPVLRNDGQVYRYDTGNPTRFVRTVRATQIGNGIDEIRVSAEVRWTTGAFQERFFTISENLYRWVPDSTVNP